MAPPETPLGPTARSARRVWIVHGDPAQRGALAHIAAAGSESVLGAPGDALFEVAEPPGVVVMGLSEEFERELDFAHRSRLRLGDAPWILLDERGEPDRVRALFDTLNAVVLAAPPSHAELRATIGKLVARPRVESLSRRDEKDRVQQRFLHWFADLDLPELLSAIDPSLVDVPVVIASEPGCGREIAARYVHAYAEDRVRASRFVALPCLESTTLGDLASALRASADLPEGCAGEPLCVWLDDASRLSRTVQRELASWLELGPRHSQVGAVRIRRWMVGLDTRASGGSASLLALEPELAATLSGLRIHIPPLRERRESVPAIAQDVADAWCLERNLRRRPLEPDAIDLLRSYPWPGNTSELEAVIRRTLVATSGSAISATQVDFDATATSGFVALESDTGEVLPDAVYLDGRDDGDLRSSVASELRPGHGIDLDEDPFDKPASVIGMGPLDPVNEVAEPDIPLALAGIDDFAQHAPAQAPTLRQDDDHSWRRLAAAVAHEVRNPLVSIRTFAELLPEHHDDAEFRGRFQELVGADVRRIEAIVGRLQSLALAGAIEREPVDLAALLETLIEEQFEHVGVRRIRVVKELDREHPIALAEPLQLRSALAGLVEHAMHFMPDAGELFVASKHHPAGLRGEPSVRILLRATRNGPGHAAGVDRPDFFDAPSAIGEEARRDLRASENSLEVAVAEATIRAHDGELAIDETGHNTVVVIDLPAPL